MLANNNIKVFFVPGEEMNEYILISWDLKGMYMIGDILMVMMEIAGTCCRLI